MQAIDDLEVKRYRTMGAIARSVILLGVLAGLAAIGAQAPERRHMTLNCAYDPAATGTMSDAALEIPGACDTATREPSAATGAASGPATSAKYGVPDAATSLDPGAAVEPLPPTF